MLIALVSALAWTLVVTLVARTGEERRRPWISLLLPVPLMVVILLGSADDVFLASLAGSLLGIAGGLAAVHRRSAEAGPVWPVVALLLVGALALVSALT